MNAKKYSKISQRIRADVMIKAREMYEVVKYLGGTVQNGNGACKKIILKDKIVTVHLHSDNDFVTRDTWKLLGVR